MQTNFTCDADGIRTSKTAGGYRRDYVIQNGKVVRETIGSGSTAKILDFIYDASGKPFALKYSTDGGNTFNTYYYVLNLQGDVVKLVEANGTVKAQYTYNAWGEILTATGTMATVNPLRYRGYYFDSETGFYYLQSRYYDPAMHRFINADSYTSTGQGFVGTNMFAYCLNNPVNLSDPAGCKSSSSEDLDGNGTPDYLDERWRDMTKKAYAYSSDHTKVTVSHSNETVSVEVTVIFSNFPENIFYDEWFLQYYCKTIERRVKNKESELLNNGKNISGSLTYEHIYQELLYHYLGYTGFSEGSWIYDKAKEAHLNYDEDRWYCYPMRYIPVP